MTVTLVVLKEVYLTDLSLLEIPLKRVVHQLLYL